ncbi:MAG: thioredoxin family protein [Candidatus Nanoarchaeia archaeon]|nr:thioredoxin family protein [Candidatus Nanoarchaeia archaeon]
MKKTFFLLFIFILLIGCSKSEPSGVVNIDQRVNEGQITTFEETGDPICYEDNKPIIRLFSTTWCPHCNWIRGTFNKVVKEYERDGKIAAYHWVLDNGDNELTDGIQESVIPPKEIGLHKKYNPSGSIPTFVFGCKYKRVGNGYEAQNNLKAEEAEFRAVIEELLKDEN